VLGLVDDAYFMYTAKYITDAVSITSTLVSSIFSHFDFNFFFLITFTQLFIIMNIAPRSPPKDPRIIAAIKLSIVGAL